MAENRQRSPTGMDFTTTTHHETYSYINPEKLDLNGKTVLITGASKGIGRAIAISLVRAGVSHIAAAARSDLSALADEIESTAKLAGRKPPRVLLLKVDVTEEQSVRGAVEEVAKSFGRLDVLINNAGYLETFKPVAESQIHDYWTSWEINLKGSYLCCKFFIPLLLKDGDKTIINLSSVGAQLVLPGASGYQTAKLALLRFTEFLMADYAQAGLLAYCTHPGGVMTELALKMPKPMHAYLLDTPDLAGDTFTWLLAERREWLAGRYISCNWDMEELMSMRDEIERCDLLKVRMAV